MPYSKIEDLPETFKNLPGDAKRQAMAVINDLLAKGIKEESAIAQAWGAVKKSYEQDKDGNWVKIQKEAELETVDIPDVEILAVGKWKGNKEVTIPKEAIPAFVESFNELTGNKGLNYEPPVKLGHAESQKLLQADGYPAAGWISSLKAEGEKLIASFKSVPKKLNEIIKAGGYRKVSAEFYQNYEIGGKKYPWVLKAVALLGGDIPAVKSISDITAQYAEMKDEYGNPYYVVTYEESLDEKSRKVRDAFRAQFQKANPLVVESGIWAEEIYPDYVIAMMGGKLYKIPYLEQSGELVFDSGAALEVKRITTYQPAQEAAADKKENISETEELMEKEIRQILGLDEKADVLEAVKALKSKAEANTRLAEGSVTLAEHQATLAEVTTLKAKIAEGERDGRVSRAISVGKITPAQKPWADKYALSDPEGFDVFIKAAPQVVQLGEKGSTGDAPENVQPTESELKMAEKLGVSKEALIKVKQQEAAGK